MESDLIRRQLHNYLDTANERFLKTVYALMKIDQEENDALTEEQTSILEERLEKYLSNPNNVSPIEDALSRIEKKI